MQRLCRQFRCVRRAAHDRSAVGGGALRRVGGAQFGVDEALLELVVRALRAAGGRGARLTRGRQAAKMGVARRRRRSARAGRSRT
eukprot:3482762-Prymnesium_polylepis.1